VVILWGEYEGLKLVLVYETNYRNQGERYKIRRIVLMASHPHHIFYHSRSSHITEQQEMIMRAAPLIITNGQLRSTVCGKLFPREEVTQSHTKCCSANGALDCRLD
jgi:hypothetical protein